ncbi:MAG: tRNA pseudouridine(13) synthase TruD [Myxococcota bacterium]
MHPPAFLWPYWTSDVASVPGRIRVRPDDFRVDEVPAYAPAGHGTHLFVRFEKEGLGTSEAVRRLARALGVDARRASWAGLKDRHAVTTQWVSFEGAAETDPEAVAIEGVRVLQSARHPRKLRTGHLRGNRFRIRVRDVPEDRMQAVRDVLTVLERDGVPNYYASQRFGREGDNVERARAWIVDGARRPRDRRQRKWDVSVLQSWLFNMVLADRVADGLFDRAVQGDVMRKEDTGGMFVSEDRDADQARMARWEISPTGPMFGSRMRVAAGEQRRREEAALTRSGVPVAALDRLGRLGPGTRRSLRVRPRAPSLEPAEDGLILSFELPAGAYATAVLRELLKEGLHEGPTAAVEPPDGNRTPGRGV